MSAKTHESKRATFRFLAALSRLWFYAKYVFSLRACRHSRLTTGIRSVELLRETMLS
jgi:hypothetical protein